MSQSMIKLVFSILGTLLISIILFIMVMGTVGQQFFWRAIEPTMLDQWTQSTMDNGAERTMVYEEQFERMKTVKFNG